MEAGEYAEFATFVALKEAHNWLALSDWKEEYRMRNAEAMESFAAAHQDEILFWQFTQYEFFRQWQELKAYAGRCGVEIMGDMPLYVSEDSAEIRAAVVAGER